METLDLREEFVNIVKDIIGNGVTAATLAPSIGIKRQTISMWLNTTRRPERWFVRKHWDTIQDIWQKSLELHELVNKKNDT